jgi:chromosome segregation ATPase
VLTQNKAHQRHLNIDGAATRPFFLSKALVPEQSEPVRIYRREDFEEATPASAPLDQALDLIQGTIGSATHSDEKIALMLEAKDFAERVGKFVKADRENRLGKLNAEFAEVNLDCRASRDRLKALQLQVAPMSTNMMNELKQRSSEARARAQEVYGSKPNDDDFPTEDELRSWDARYKRAAKVVSDAAAAEGRLMQDIAQLNGQIEQEASRLADLKQNRQRIKLAMEGKVMSEFGLGAEL